MPADDERETGNNEESGASYDAESDSEPAGKEGDLDVEPTVGGYGTRNPETEMPRLPSVPDDPEERR